MSTVLLTGASGAVGANLAKRYLDLGWEVCSIRHDERPCNTAQLIGIENKISWARGSVLDENFVKRVVADFAPDLILHLAALPIVQVATRTAIPVFTTNFLGTINVLEAIRENERAGKHIRLIAWATDKVYGSVGQKAYTEDMPLNALGVYECSKAAADLAVRTYATCGFVNAALVVRPCNLLCPGDLNLGRVVPRTIVPCLRGESPRIYRTEYLREFLHVQDMAEAALALDNLLVTNPTKYNGQAFNIGSGEQRNIEDTVTAVLEHFPGIQPIWLATPEQARIEIPFQKLDTTKMYSHTGWRARIGFKLAIEDLVTWWREHWNAMPPYVKNWRVSGWH